MTPEEAHTKPTLRERGHSLVEWTKIISAFLLVLSFLSTAATEFVGPGVKPLVQRFIGIEELKNENQVMKDQIETLISYIEPPKVVVWQRIRQLGECSSAHCEFDVSFSRTPFGADCGIPSVVAQMRLAEGFPFQIRLGNFTPIQGVVEGSRVTVPLTISSRIPSGNFEWRVINTYPKCSFPGEPIPRKSPWWPVTVTQNEG